MRATSPKFAASPSPATPLEGGWKGQNCVEATLKGIFRQFLLVPQWLSRRESRRRRTRLLIRPATEQLTGGGFRFQ